jgi:transposase
MQVSPDTLLHEIRRAPVPAFPSPRVLGVDDWAYCRGQRYGTILCDLERRCAIDLLPDRSSATFSQCLKTHQGVEIISRDRGDFYIKGATVGAPGAIQVADRWYLLRNLRDALTRVVDRHGCPIVSIRHACPTNPQVRETRDDALVAPPATDVNEKPLTHMEKLRQQRRARRFERYQQVLALHSQGVSARAIAQRLGIHRSTVHQSLSFPSFPERATRAYRRHTDPIATYLHERWQAGCRNAAQVERELRARGFTGSYDMIRRRVAKWRRLEGRGRKSPKVARTSQERLSSSRIAWLLLKSRSKRTLDDHALFVWLRHNSPAQLQTVTDLARQFVAMVKRRRALLLDSWIERVSASEVPVELRRFARGLVDDLAAVRAALTLPWSNGQTEGQINRLKLIKRQMYGRASFDLLRQRVVQCGLKCEMRAQNAA